MLTNDLPIPDRPARQNGGRPRHVAARVPVHHAGVRLLRRRRGAGRHPAALLVLAPLLAGGGCFHYTTADGLEPDRGTPVRLHLDRPTSFDVTGLTVHDVVRVDGEFVSRDPGRVILSATWLDAATGRGFPGGGWTVRVDEGEVARFEVRQVSWLRTGLVFAGFVAASYFGFEAFQGSGGGEGRSGGGGRTN